jgi:hypothetical protein
MIEGFDHVGTDHQCNVCQCDFTDDEGGIQGYLGILPVAFCPTCFAGLCDMVEQLNGREWEGLTDDDHMEAFSLIDGPLCETCKNTDTRPYGEAIEAKLKEKNYEDQD